MLVDLSLQVTPEKVVARRKIWRLCWLYYVTT